MVPGRKELARCTGQDGAAKFLRKPRSSIQADDLEKSATQKRGTRYYKKLAASQKTELLPLFCVPIGVDRREAISLFGKIFERENSGHRANRYAGATIDAFGRVNVQLRLGLESRFVLAGMDAVHRANVH